MKKLMIAGLVIVGFALANQTSTAEASRFGFHFGGGGVHVGIAHGHHGHRRWYNTSHCDWHPRSYRRRRNHYHYIPRHYDYHRTGYWNTHCW